MSANPCPVCGHDSTACTGNTPVNARMIITSSGVVKARERVPMQPRTGRWGGRASYVGAGTGAIEIYDPEHPHVRLVEPDGDAGVPPASDGVSNGGSDGGPEPGESGDDTAPAAAVSGEKRRRRRKDEEA